MEKISVIVPIYNGEKYLDRCIKSLINQTYKNIEFIFLNDGSTDNSLKIIKKYASKDKRIIVIDKENSGVSDTRNLGISKATGEYICFCDCDDVYELNYLERMHDIIKKENVDVVKCNYQVIDTSNKIIDSGNLNNLINIKYDHKAIINEIIPLILSGKIPCFCHLIMIKKSSIKYDFPVDIAMMEDVVFYLRLLLNIKSLYIIDDKLYTIMFNPEGATNNVKNYERNILNVITVNKYIKKELAMYHLANKQLITCANINALNSISDFIFRYYLASKNNITSLCQRIRTNDYVKLINETDLKNINLQRRMILSLINKERYLSLHIFLVMRKIIYKLRRI